MDKDADSIARKMVELDLWDAVAPYNWAVKPRGTALPYFCTVMGDSASSAIKVHFMMLEGWQTFHDYIRTRIDGNFGFYSTPSELPQFELVVCKDGSFRIFRRDPGYAPRPPTPAENALCARILWEAYGMILRMEADQSLAMSFAAENAIFARVEGADGVWRDEPLAVPAPRPHVERIGFRKSDIAAAKDLPFASEEKISVDFRITPSVQTAEARPRTGYALVGVDSATGRKLMDLGMVVNAETGLRGMWESMPSRFLGELIARGRIPGEIKVRSGRVFRLLRTLGAELPFKLSLHDALPEIEAAFAARR